MCLPVFPFCLHTWAIQLQQTYNISLSSIHWQQQWCLLQHELAICDCFHVIHCVRLSSSKKCNERRNHCRIHSCLDDRKVEMILWTKWTTNRQHVHWTSYDYYSTTNIVRPTHSSSREVNSSRTGAPLGNVSWKFGLGCVELKRITVQLLVLVS